MGTALLVFQGTTRALMGLELLSNTGWINDEKANEIIGKIPRLALPLVEQIEGLHERVRELLDRGNVTADELEEINARATAAEEALLAVLESKVGAEA
jgi:hypothetical protein